ncbi:MAG: helix-turn-helix domain-containing protein, partial [Bradyrhizobium sp.]
MTEASGEAASKHHIPVIESMIELLWLLERRPNGATIREAVEMLKIPRSTIYRILNTLGSHGFVRRSAAGSYTLGESLVALAARVVPKAPGYDLAALVQPHMER